MSYRIIETTGRGRQWLVKRHGFIGASEAAVIVNLSPFEQPHDLWARKTSGLTTDDDIDLFYFAKRLEAPIAERAAEKWPDEFGRMVKSPGLLQWVEHPHLAATPDYLVTTDDAGDVTFQIKTVGPYARKKWGDAADQSDVPDEYRIQVIQENAILGKPYGYIEPLFGLTDLARPIRIDTDLEFLDWYVTESAAWWQTHMIEGIEPELRMGDDLVDRWPGNMGEKIDGTPEIVEQARAGKRYRDIERKQAEQLDEAWKFDIQSFMGDATELIDPDTGETLVTWRPKKSPAYLNVPALREAHPAIVAEFTSPGKPQRSLLFKPTEQSRAELDT